MKFPAVVPGGIILTDIWLYLDQLLDHKMLVKQHMSKQLQAGLEAERCKKLMGALRYLYRNSISFGGLVAIVTMFFHNVWAGLVVVVLEKTVIPAKTVLH